jgi:hypothetical protein
VVVRAALVAFGVVVVQTWLILMVGLLSMPEYPTFEERNVCAHCVDGDSSDTCVEVCQ